MVYKSKFPLFRSGEDWTIPKIKNVMDVIEGIAHEWKMPLYPNQIEVIDFEGMINSYVSIGVPILYNHWSFGKQFEIIKKRYNLGVMGLALEMVLNTNPCINYILEQNDMTSQCMVLCHSSVGHNFVFKNNFVFQEFTEPDAIVNYLKFAKAYIQKCEEKYGEDEVEDWLDCCHAISDYGIDSFTRRTKKKEESDEDYLAAKLTEERIKNFDAVWEATVPKIEQKEENSVMLAKPEENLLYFIEKNAKWLPPWKREIIRIVRKVAQYFYPQAKDKVINEGFASFIHMELMTTLYERGYIDDGSYMQFLHLHSGVINQRGLTVDINPYTLGYNIFRDIKRACKDQTEEDKLFYGTTSLDYNYLDFTKSIAAGFVDSSFLAQFLSPKVIRDMKLFSIEDKEDDDFFTVTEIHDEIGYDNIRKLLSIRYERSNSIPNIQVVGADLNGDRTLYLKHFRTARPLHEDDADETLEYVSNLWEFEINFESV
jgi:spore cortex formation protein SpoVR/YcgB (stage V sporulation)